MTPLARRVDHVIFDVDDVLINMDEALLAAEAALEAPLARRFGPLTAQKARAAFTANYQTLLDHLRLPVGERNERYEKLRARIDAWQQGVTQAGFEVKQWSRDTLLAVSLEDAGEQPTAAAVNEALAEYWQTLTNKTRLYPDAEALCDRLKQDGITFHLATNSDGFLSLDDARRTFLYDPASSAERKVARLGVTRVLGAARQNITVGDPIGKPGPEYYARVVKEFSDAQGGPINLTRTLAVGDSLKADVVPFLLTGVALGAWLVRAARASGVDELTQVPIVRSLSELGPMIWPGSPA
jgi:FMN phosphatase YigB (HAD superfamily)